MSKIIPRRPMKRDLVQADTPFFDLVAVLPGRASSRHSQRAYYRWIERYLSDMANLERPKSMTREQHMSALPLKSLLETMSAQQLRAWLGGLVGEGHGKEGVNQARSSVVTLAALLAEAELLPDYISAGISNVRPPKAEDGQRPGRWLSIDELRLLMASARDIATSDNMRLRNQVVATMLCTMALRREELSIARWGDLSIQNNRAVMRVHGKGRKSAMIDIPKPVLNALDSWRRAMVNNNAKAAPETPLIRRIWKGGRISKWGLTTEGIWWMVGDAAQAAGIGHVAPHDLRRSVAGALQESGVPIEKISRLLRHSNVAVTERYLSRLPQANEGAILMSGVLGLEDEDPFDWRE
ncbi:MAG: site-specific integrase [Chloroflexota bacterium]|nr:site-specific integrase [Chloroflexota bacterium]